MLQNLGILDRIIRTLLAFIIAMLFITDQTFGITAAILGSIAFALAITAALALDPLYLLFSISTRRKKEKK